MRGGEKALHKVALAVPCTLMKCDGLASMVSPSMEIQRPNPVLETPALGDVPSRVRTRGDGVLTHEAAEYFVHTIVCIVPVKSSSP